MSIYYKFVIFTTLVFGGGLFSIPLINNISNLENTDIQLLIGLRIEFPQSEFDNSTSGNEIFLIESNDTIEFSDLDSIENKEMIKDIERKMLNYAKELQFEKAALLRDQIEKIKNNQAKLVKFKKYQENFRKILKF